LTYKTRSGLQKIQKFDDCTWVKLDDQDIVSIDLSPIQECKELELLHLYDNYLEEIDLSPLQYCTHFKKLGLGANQIRRIELKPLEKCNKFEELDLSDNQLEWLDLEVSMNWSLLKEIDLRSNSLHVIDITSLLFHKKLINFEVDSEVLLIANPRLRNNRTKLAPALSSIKHLIKYRETTPIFGDTTTDLVIKCLEHDENKGDIFRKEGEFNRALRTYTELVASYSGIERISEVLSEDELETGTQRLREKLAHTQFLTIHLEALQIITQLNEFESKIAIDEVDIIATKLEETEVELKLHIEDLNGLIDQSGSFAQSSKEIMSALSKTVEEILSSLKSKISSTRCMRELEKVRSIDGLLNLTTEMESAKFSEIRNRIETLSQRFTESDNLILIYQKSLGKKEDECIGQYTTYRKDFLKKLSKVQDSLEERRQSIIYDVKSGGRVPVFDNIAISDIVTVIKEKWTELEKTEFDSQKYWSLFEQIHNLTFEGYSIAEHARRDKEMLEFLGFRERIRRELPFSRE
jgi:hypothetical protein